MNKPRFFLFAALTAALLSITPARAQFVMGTLDPDGTLAANSDQRIPTQAAVVTYVGASIQTAIDTDGTFAADSDTVVPSQKAVATYVQAHSTAFNTLTVTASTGTLTIADGKTLTVSNSITLAGTDSRTYTFPTTNATLARTDAAQTFTGDQTFAGFVKSTSASAGIGYATGAGAAVTQATNRTTGVTATGVCGAITTHNASLAAGASATFTVTDTSVAIGDVVLVAIRSGAVHKETRVAVTAVAAGSFEVTVHNQHATTAETGAIVINFAVIKAVSS